MKSLEDILNGVDYSSRNFVNVEILDVCDDSRKVKEGSLFIATKGIVVDGHKFIKQAIESDVRCVVYEIDQEIDWPDDVVAIKVENSTDAKSQIAKNFFQDPSSHLELIGVTGTNGKTTVCSILYDLFEKLGFKVGLISTISYKYNGNEIPSTHTTPDVISLNRMISEMVDVGCQYVFMEVSSHAVDQKRIDGLNYKVAAFTNLTHDHLDYHGSFMNYLRAKQKFFDRLDKNSVAITNGDDKNGEVMLQNSKALKKTYGLRKISDYKAKILTNSLLGLELEIDQTPVHFQFVGSFNAYNLMLVYAIATELGIDKTELLTVMSSLKPAPGRFETLNLTDGIVGIVDYAHTPDALKNILETINQIKSASSKVITVVGCGGNRDKEKRPKIARIAQELSDCLVITSDNPRDEDPQGIIEDMKRGLLEDSECQVIDIEDRKKAIELTKMISKANDVIVIAGKGHEKYQIVKGEKLPFDDVEILRNTFDS